MQMLALARISRRASVLVQLFPPLSEAKSHIFPHLYWRTNYHAFDRALLGRPQGDSFPLFKSLNAPFHHGSPDRSKEQDLVDLLREAATLPLEPESMESIERLGIDQTPELVFSVIEKLREEWRPALLAFKWGQKRDCINEETYNLMVYILGSHGKFSIAWCLIRDIHQIKKNTRRAMLTMIDRYAAANNPSKAIWTFQLMEMFRISPDQEAFHFLLNTLCLQGNMEEAEEFMLLNKTLFPLETDSFNIILNGWCNITVDISEAKRIWREMSKCCILPNGSSYTHMISCFSKVGNLFDSLRLYDEMKRWGWTPGLEVYNSLINVLTQENCLAEALKMLGKIKDLGLKPNNATYNSLICPLCKLEKTKDAREVLFSMLEEKIEPTVDTYNAFLQCTDFEGTLEVLPLMRKANLGPSGDTFFLILEKFIKLNQVENTLKVWVEMREYDIEPDVKHYEVLVCSLATSGYLIKANEIYSEMMSKGFPDDPKLKMLLKKHLSSSKRECMPAFPRENHVNLRKGTMVKINKHQHLSNKRMGKKKLSRIPTKDVS
ncbi:hypothetical protein SAY86_020885 [Trapa natans]|uniref:Pentatricopeptide repeat-containing protein n=1 Tax=Trapa natans TaxID=22666 RepID=A0AAN7M184_TRANT|nr:hypothetical protein SAY86_020885 [Trapa natans]